MVISYKKAKSELQSAREHFVSAVDVPHSWAITKDPNNSGYALKLQLYRQPSSQSLNLPHKYHGLNIVIDVVPGVMWG